MMDFLTKLQQYRRLTRSKNKALSQLQEDQLRQYRLAVSASSAIVLPIWERYGYGRGHYPDGRSSKGRECQVECRAEELRSYAKLDELRLGYTADRKRIIDEYTKAVIEL